MSAYQAARIGAAIAPSVATAYRRNIDIQQERARMTAAQMARLQIEPKGGALWLRDEGTGDEYVLEAKDVRAIVIAAARQGMIPRACGDLAEIGGAE